MNETPLTNMNGEHELAIAVVTPTRNRSTYSTEIEVRGIVLASTVNAFINRRFVWTCEVNESYARVLRNFLSSAYPGAGYAAFCLGLDTWCSVDRRATVGVIVNYEAVTFRRSTITLAGLPAPASPVPTERAMTAEEVKKLASALPRTSSDVVTFSQEYARDLDLDDGDDK